ncbi:MAG: hypothetical protein PVJ72_05630 [Gammaproteobacteria bacterium]|jgi:hypothetical protein
MMSANPVLDQTQIDQLSTLCFINRIDSHLKIVSSVKVFTTVDGTFRILLVLEIFYDEEKIDELSFNLHNYDYEDIVHTARNIRSNEFILQEVDNLLAGNIE